MKKKAYCYKINLHFLFLTAICHKGGKFLEIRVFFQFFSRVLIFTVSTKLNISRVKIFAILGKSFKTFKVHLSKLLRYIFLNFLRSKGDFLEKDSLFLYLYNSFVNLFTYLRRVFAFKGILMQI